MPYARINLAAVAVSAVLYWMLGAVWFALLFGKAWLAGIGKSEAEAQAAGHSPVPYILSFVFALVLAFVLAWVLTRTGEPTVARGIKISMLLWLGLIATTWLTNYLFEGRSLQLFAINAGYPLAGMLLMGVVLGAWKKK